MQLKIKAMIFDVDGTLCETEDWHRRAFNQAFEHFSLAWHWDVDLYRRLLQVTGGKERLWAYAQEQGVRLDDDKIAQMHEWKTARYHSLLTGGDVKLRAGITALIDLARARKIKLAIATTTNVSNVEVLIQSCLGVPAAQIFDVIAAGDMVKNKKPAPDVYLLALKNLALDPHECIAFEDSRNGLLSAQSAGIPVVLSPSVYNNDENTQTAEYKLDSFEQAPNLSIFQD